MFRLSRNLLRLAAAGAFVVHFASDSAADEMVQNWGPVGPTQAVLATIGSTHLIAFFEPGGGRCAVNAVIWDNLAIDAGESAKRIRVNVEPGDVIHIDTAHQKSLHLQCGSNAATLAVVDINALSASGITAQPPEQPVKQGF